jgi:aspartyl-tRNA(Asn)/glutamyl-tRNA(Gln) amidotransferase subunit C
MRHDSAFDSELRLSYMKKCSTPGARGAPIGSARQGETPTNISAVIDRDQVLHVARLARLRLEEEEIDRMSRELSTVLDHIEKISELDLDGVPPTSHVVEVENVTRPDEPRPCWPRDRVLAEAPDAAAGGFRVPTPGR